MSTRATLIYNDRGLQIYQELLDNTVHVEIEKPDMVIDIEIMSFSEWMSAGLPINCVHIANADELPQCEKCGSSFLWPINGSNGGFAVCCNPDCGNFRAVCKATE